jgi:geranylgeranyl pyrophosphate synthase
MAVPLWASTCKDSRTDLDWVREMIDTPHTPAAEHTRNYVHLMRHARAMFEPERLVELLPPRRKFDVAGVSEGGDRLQQDPLSSTEAMAYDFLGRGGKYARPFVTLAAYDAMRRDGPPRCTGPNGAAHVARLPEAVQRVAAAIEIFHKASLVHDDIEDDDAFRYGEPTLHRRYGVASALNVGDFLVGWGYRVVADETATLGADVTADILAHLSECHTRLCEGQGAELAWRAAPGKTLLPLDALKIYALKTAPAFEAALLAGLRMAGPIGRLREPIGRFARHLGVAFQILNDLDDWRREQPNKRRAATDVLGGRPTVLWAIALAQLGEPDRGRLQSLASAPTTEAVVEVERLYQKAGVFDQADALVEKHHQRAREIASAFEPRALADLLHYLGDAILQ